MKHPTAMVAVLMLVAAAPAARADTYVGASASLGAPSSDASVGRLTSALAGTADVESVRISESGTAWRLFIGKRLHPNFAVELGFADLATIRVDVDASAVDADAHLEQLARHTPVAPGGVTLDAVGDWSLAAAGLQADWATRARLLARAGLFAWRSDVGYSNDAGDRFRREDDGVDLHVGVGAGWMFSDRVSARLEWEMYDSSTRMTTLSLGLVYSF